MGTHFFWVFDIAVLAILAVFLYKGIRQGFVAAIAGAVSLILAFALSLPLSALISNAIYENLIKDTVAEQINSQIESVIDNKLVSDIKKVDMSKIKVNGSGLSAIDMEENSEGEVSLDLSDLDLTGTGIEDIDLSSFGLSDEDIDYSSIDLGTIVMSASDIEEYGIENMILATVLSDNISNSDAISSITDAVEEMAESIPVLSGIADSVISKEEALIQNVVVSIINTDTEDIAGTITDDMVKPIVVVPMRALIFTILFVIIAIVLNIVTRLLKFINEIPLVGNANKALGAVAGLAEAVIVIFLVCIFIQVIVTLSGNGLIFLNTMTIDETIIFHFIYDFKFLDLLA